MLNRFARFSLAIAEIDRCWHRLAADKMAKYGLESSRNEEIGYERKRIFLHLQCQPQEVHFQR